MLSIFADLHGIPASLFITSTRDLLLSGTSRLHLAYLRAGVDARLIVRVLEQYQPAREPRDI